MNSKQLNYLLGGVAVIAVAALAYIAMGKDDSNPVVEDSSNPGISMPKDTPPAVKNNTNQASPTPTSSAWKVYSNNRVGYEFEYPASGLKMGLDETIKYPSTLSKDEDLVQFVLGENSFSIRTHVGVKEQTIEAWIQGPNSNTNNNLADYNKRTVGGLTAYTGKSIAVTYVMKNGNVYVIASHAGVEPNFDTDKTYQHMLSSFKFTK